MALHFKKAWKLFWKTFPFVLIRLALYLLFAIIAIGIFLGIVFVITKIAGKGLFGLIGIIMLFIGFLVFLGIWKVIRRYTDYLVKGAHVAVVTQLVLHESLPAGVGMISFGVSKVKQRFASTSAFFLIDQIIKGVIKGINTLLSRLLWGLRFIPGGKNIVQIIQNIVNMFLTHLDEAILSFIYAHDEIDAWAGARDGLILYFKNWKPMLSTAAILGVFIWLIGAVLAIIFYFALAPLSALLPAGMATAFWIILLILIVTVHGIFISPFALVTMIVTYQESIKEQEADPETQAKLEEAVPKFREITARAGPVTAKKRGLPPLAPPPVAGAPTAIPGISEESARAAIEHIKKFKARGLTDSQIKSAFIKKGWQATTVDALIKRAKEEIKAEKQAKMYLPPPSPPPAAPPASPAPPVPPKPKKK